MGPKIRDNLDYLACKRLRSEYPGIFYHCATIFTEKRGAICPLSYGENQFRGKKCIHAEADAINNIPFKKDGRLLKVSLLVLRVTKSGRYMMSKPCMHCIKKMNDIISKNYKISTVYYTNESGEIEKYSLKHLTDEPDKHISKWNLMKKRTFTDG